MTYIDKVKEDALETGLKREIDRLRYQITAHKFSDIEGMVKRDGQQKQVFTRLGEAIVDVEEDLKKMRLCLQELKGIDPMHR